MKNNIIIGIICLAVGAALGVSLKPTKVVTKTEVVEKVVTLKEEAKTKIVRVVETVGVDGSKTTTTDSVEESNSKEASSVDRESKQEKVVFNDSGIRLDALVSGNRKLELDYGLMLSRKIVGPVSLGVFVMKQGELGASLGIQF
jgi:hypothetical protein